MRKKILSYCFAVSVMLTGCSFGQKNMGSALSWEEIQDYPSVLVYANDHLQIFDHIVPESEEHYLAYFIEGNDEVLVCKRLNSDGTMYRGQEEENDEGI